MLSVDVLNKHAWNSVSGMSCNLLHGMFVRTNVVSILNLCKGKFACHLKEVTDTNVSESLSRILVASARFL